jgi:hypothetical protein
VERMMQYMNIPSEPPLTISETRPNDQWPTKGEIELRNLHVCLFSFMYYYTSSVLYNCCARISFRDMLTVANHQFHYVIIAVLTCPFVFSVVPAVIRIAAFSS